MSCPQCLGIEETFNGRLAERELRDYQAHGPGKTTRLLINALTGLGIKDLTLLDIGGGVGVIQHELIKDGVASATSVDASSAYLQAARQEAQRQGLADRVCYLHGDFVQVSDKVPPADIVTMERVICCYPDMRALVSQSSARSRRYFGVIFPRDTWWIKWGAKAFNFFRGLGRGNFHFFVHSTADVEALIRDKGFERVFYQRSGFWQVILYARAEV